MNFTLRRKYFLLLLDGIFYYAKPFWPNVLFKAIFHMALIFCLGNQPIDLNEGIKVLYYYYIALYFSFNSINVASYL